MPEIAPEAPQKVFVGVGKFIRSQTPNEITRRLVETYDEKIVPKLHGKAAEIAVKLLAAFAGYAKVAGIAQTALEVELTATALVGAALVGKKWIDAIKSPGELPRSLSWFEDAETKAFGQQFKDKADKGSAFEFKHTIGNDVHTGEGRVRVLADKDNQHMIIIARQQISGDSVRSNGETRVLFIDTATRQANLAAVSDGRRDSFFIKSTDAKRFNWDAFMKKLDRGNPFESFEKLDDISHEGAGNIVTPQMTELLRKGTPLQSLEERLVHLGGSKGIISPMIV